MIRGRTFLAWAVIEAGLCFQGCGNRLPPPGGPVDEIPPRIISLRPDSNAVGVDVRVAIRITFDEEIQVAMGREGIAMNPFDPDLRVEYGYKTIEVRREGGLNPGCTHCLQLLPEIKDLRGNPLAGSWKFCFSTGDSLTRGNIRGVIEGPEERVGDLIFQAVHLPDSLVYRARVGSDGAFTLTHLPRGSYRLLAFIDSRRDSRYDPVEEPGEEIGAELGGEPIEVRFDLKSPD